MSASSASPRSLTRSAALGPSPPMRMSSGPSPRKEKPRSASSSCMEETPRSSATPSAASTPLAAQERRPSRRSGLRPGSAGRRSCRQAARRSAMAPGIAVEPDHAAVGGFQNGAAVAAGPEGAVDIDAAVAGRQQLQHLGQQHGAVRGARSCALAGRPARQRAALVQSARGALPTCRHRGRWDPRSRRCCRGRRRPRARRCPHARSAPRAG